MAKTLVLYYSATGTTVRMAKQIADKLNADQFELQADQPYTNADLNWNNPQSRSSLEQHEHDSRVAVKENLPNIDDYDNIVIGSPIWFGIPPRLIADAIDKLPLTGKNLALFATSGGSSYDRSQSFVERTVRENNYYDVTVQRGTILNRPEQIDDWAKRSKLA